MSRILTLLLLTCFLAPIALAQDTVLPDLAPREVEITGDLTIAFPALRRQPIVGFNPPPAVPELDSGRRPFAEPYKQPSADLPPSPLQPPAPPEVSAVEQRVPLSGLLDVRAGTHLDRSLDADITLVDNASTTALVDVAYFGTDGHEVAVGGQTVRSARDLLDGSIELEQRAGPVEFRVSTEAFRHAYSLFGAVPDPAGPARSNPDRTFTGYEAAVELGSRPGTRVDMGLRVSAGGSAMDTDVFDPAIRIDPATDHDASFVQLGSYLTVPIRDGAIRLSGDGISTGLDESSFPGSTMKGATGELAVDWTYSSKLDLTVGAAFLGFDSQQQNVHAERNLSYIAPVISARYAMSNALTLTLGTQPSMPRMLHQDLYRTAPFAADQSRVLPSLTTVDATAGIEFQSAMATASARVGWQQSPWHAYAFDQETQSRGFQSGYFSFDHGEMAGMYAHADFSLIPAGGLEIGTDVRFQNMQLTDLDVDAPYVSPLVIGGFVSHSALEGDLETRVRLSHAAKRPSDRVGVAEAPSVTRLSMAVSWFFHANYGIVTSVRHLGSSQEFWNGYEMEGNAFHVGFRYRW